MREEILSESVGIGVDLGDGTVLFVPNEPESDQQVAIHKLNKEKNLYRETLEEIDTLSNKGCEEWTPVETLSKIDKVLDKVFGR